MSHFAPKVRGGIFARKKSEESRAGNSQPRAARASLRRQIYVLAILEEFSPLPGYIPLVSRPVLRITGARAHVYGAIVSTRYEARENDGLPRPARLSLRFRREPDARAGNSKVSGAPESIILYGGIARRRERATDITRRFQAPAIPRGGTFAPTRRFAM